MRDRFGVTEGTLSWRGPPSNRCEFAWTRSTTRAFKPKVRRGVDVRIAGCSLLSGSQVGLCGCDDRAAVELFAKSRYEWLRHFFTPHATGRLRPAGVPSHDTFGRVMGMIDSQAVFGLPGELDLRSAGGAAGTGDRHRREDGPRLGQQDEEGADACISSARGRARKD